MAFRKGILLVGIMFGGFCSVPPAAKAAAQGVEQRRFNLTQSSSIELHCNHFNHYWWQNSIYSITVGY